MAWRPEHLVIAGELDNTEPGWTIGWLELEGCPERLRLKLAGNCHPDLAGWKFRIKRVTPAPPKDFDGEEPPPYEEINPDQSGHVGDITADQMIKDYEMPTEELVQRLHAGEEPEFTWRKCLYLEWFSNHNGRVVIQSPRLEVERIGDQAFELSEAQWRDQQFQNQQEMDYFITQLEDALEDGLPDEE